MKLPELEQTAMATIALTTFHQATTALSPRVLLVLQPWALSRLDKQQEVETPAHRYPKMGVNSLELPFNRTPFQDSMLNWPLAIAWALL